MPDFSYGIKAGLKRLLMSMLDAVMVMFVKIILFLRLFAFNLSSILGQYLHFLAYQFRLSLSQR